MKARSTPYFLRMYSVWLGLGLGSGLGSNLLGDEVEGYMGLQPGPHGPRRVAGCPHRVAGWDT